MFWLIRDIRFYNHCLPFLWGPIWFNDSWHFIQHTLSYFTAIKNKSLSPWQPRRFIQCCQTDEQLWPVSLLTHGTIGGTSRIILSTGLENRLMDGQVNTPSNLTLFCILCCFQKQRDSRYFSLLLIWLGEAVREVPLQKLWSKGLSPHWALKKCPLQCLCGGSSEDKSTTVSGEDTWWQTNVWGQHGLVEITVRNVLNSTSSYPGESGGEKGLMTSETCSFSTLPEMPNHGATYQSRAWNVLVHRFGWPAPLMNTLWKQFSLCNAGESQQIINLSQYSPSAQKYNNLLCSCKGSHSQAWKLVSA